VDAARNEVVAAEREQAGKATRLAALTEAETRLSADLEEAIANRRAAAEAFEEMAHPEAIESPMESLRGKVAADRNAVSEARMALAEIDREAQTRAARIAAIEREEAAWAGRRTEVEKQIASLETRRKEAEEQRQSLLGKPEEIAAKRRALSERAAE